MNVSDPYPRDLAGPAPSGRAGQWTKPIGVLVRWSATAAIYLVLAGPLLARQPPHQESLLQQAGFDLSQLDAIQNGSVQAFVEEEFEAFQQLAELVLQWETDPPQTAADTFDLLAALQTPDHYRGSYVLLKGTVRRISPIQITASAMRQRLGLETYYQVDFFVSTQNTNFSLRDSQGQVVIGGSFGVTLILLEMPEMIGNAKPHDTLTLPGIYLKNWSHKTLDTREVSSELRRPNPIIFGIGSQARQWDTRGGRQGIDWVIGWFWGGLACLLAGLAIWQWRGRRRQPPRFAEGTASHDGSRDWSQLE